MRLLDATPALLLPALASTTVLASSAPASTSAFPTPIIGYSDDGQIVEYWSPIATITHSASAIVNADLEAGLDHDLLRREVVTGAPAAQATDPTQISPITTYQANQMVNGVAQQVDVVYTQLFSIPPDQGAAPASGAIGLGTIQGEVGVVKTAAKRDAQPEPTELTNVRVDRRTPLEETTLDNAVVERDEDVQILERRSIAGKVDANKAGSALALLVAITAMIVF
jgi:hypothetical protein